MAGRLIRINFLLLVITFHRYIFNWLCGLYPSLSGSNLCLRILTFIASILFCFFVLYPLLLMAAYFLTCKYYHYSILLSLGYFTVPWITSGFLSLWRYEFDMGNALKLSAYLSRQCNPTSVTSASGADRASGRFTLLNPGLVRIPETRAPPFQQGAEASSSPSFSDVSTQTGSSRDARSRSSGPSRSRPGGGGDARGKSGGAGDAGRTAGAAIAATNRRRKKKKQVEFHKSRKRKATASHAEDDDSDSD